MIHSSLIVFACGFRHFVTAADQRNRLEEGCSSARRAPSSCNEISVFPQRSAGNVWIIVLHRIVLSAAQSHSNDDSLDRSKSLESTGNRKTEQWTTAEEPEFFANSLKRFSVSFSETGFGGPRMVTNGCVTVRRPPVCVSENDTVFGFSFFHFFWNFNKG